MDLSSKIEKLRKQKGLSQEEFANMMGVSRQSVFKWESGENTPDLEKIKKITSIFGVSFDVLLNDSIELDDKNRIIVQKEETKIHKPFKKRFVLIPVIAVFSIAIVTVSSIFIAKAVEQKQVEEKYNAPINNVISLINNIGEVTLESEPKIIEAETAYEALEEKQKEKVTNYQLLLDARNQYELLANDDREEKTKDDVSRTITLEDIKGHWKSDYDEWKIGDVGAYHSVLYWTSINPNGSVISAYLKDSIIKGYNNKTQKMEISLYHYYSHGEEFLPISAKKNDNGQVNIYYSDREYTLIAYL